MVKVSITASHDGGNIEVLSIGEPVISGRTAKATVTLHIKPGEFAQEETARARALYGGRVGAGV